MNLTSIKILFFLFFLTLFSCKKTSTEESQGAIFTLLNPEQTNIAFQNNLEEGPNTNILMYEYFYNGGGVSTGDYNQDGLIDVYFTSNMGENRLYLNRGKMKFEDVTIETGVSGRPGPWKTGANSVDINGDGKLDIFICYSGAMPAEKRINQLFINKGNTPQGVPQFEEKAAEYGLTQPSYSNQSYFFDCDKDGDLDMLLLNHNPKNLPLISEAATLQMLQTDNKEMGLRLFKQNNGKFTDQTKSCGIAGSELSYGLGIGISDLNNDGWPDFYVSNDYAVPDYLYINNKNGTFTNQVSKSMGHTGQFSMGNDVADIDNDGNSDVFTLDMLPEDNQRQKLLMAPDNFAKFEQNVRSGFYYQYMRNMLHLNNGNGTFSEIGQLAGVSNTDWSWSALLADYDNDGFKDLFITNGYLRDYTNMDFIKYMENYVKQKGRLQREDVLEIIKQMPASNVSNYMFRNSGDLSFKNQTKNWGLERPSNSNGATYADFDNDGDLDLVTNNINQPVFLYQNESKGNYLNIKLEGEKGNTQGLGSKVKIFTKSSIQQLEQYPTRGYLSSVSPVLHFGLGKNVLIDSLEIVWNNGKKQVLKGTKANQLLTLKESDAIDNASFAPKNEKPIFAEIQSGVNFENINSPVNDFERQLLLPNQLSYLSPCLAKGDINSDGLEDIVIGGAKDQKTQAYIQTKTGSFQNLNIASFEKDKGFVDGDIAIFDANKDGQNDILIASGGYHALAENDSLLQDRLYINKGKGVFERAPFPKLAFSKSCVRVNDINKDGFPDLFIGSRVTPGKYPLLPKSYILINNKNGQFSDQTKNYSPELENIGMVTDAAWIDLNNDKGNELVVVGEFMPVTVFSLKGNKFENVSSSYFDQNYSGWWNKIATGDFNKDGKTDLVIGNIGINNQFNASEKEPVEMVSKDFDNNGSLDPVMSYYIKGINYPFVTRDEFINQLTYQRPKYTNYDSYSNVSMAELFSSAELENSLKLSANHMATTLFLSTKDGKYKVEKLPIQAQFSTINAISVLDCNGDGNQDLVLAGNNSYAKLRIGKFDANFGALLLGNGKGQFNYVSQTQSGFNIWGDVRSVVEINKTLFFGINQGKLKAYKY